MKILAILFIFLMHIGLAAQDGGSIRWKRISSPKNDFTALIPADFLIDNERSSHRAYANVGGAAISIDIAKNSNAKNHLRQIRQFRKAGETDYLTFTSGDFIGDSYTHDSEKRYSRTFYLASTNAFYIISVSAETSTNPILEKFLFSVRLADKPLVKQEHPEEISEPAISMASLPTSRVVLEALKRKNTKKINIIYEEKAEGASSPESSETDSVQVNYSRPLIVLRRTKAEYTRDASSHGVNGVVNLRILFRADGLIGDITVITKLSDGLTQQAIDAAKNIKFLPAEISGKPVDVQRLVQYSFSIY